MFDQQKVHQNSLEIALNWYIDGQNYHRIDDIKFENATMRIIKMWKQISVDRFFVVIFISDSTLKH